AVAARADHPQVLVDRKRREQPAALRHVADPETGDLVRLAADELLTAIADRAGDAGGRDAHDRVAQRRLAHAVAADDAERSALHGERDVLERLRSAVVGAQPLDLEQR